jgi:hypothetical protein
LLVTQLHVFQQKQLLQTVTRLFPSPRLVDVIGRSLMAFQQLMFWLLAAAVPVELHPMVQVVAAVAGK